ncbi:hypothetical protein P3T36_001115 [Kitasatospora sp. MAP12-15]|uniref:class F sortase n=1 Tax=unclassified Kitasatospora TaxID=2633591 RepID=UPI002474FBF2|nr:class F sortase [Kitasatospora sp. MAP12-44]MDH6114764.1 hypothetical protein [Kitasatospora sp. MAP12-44]
MVGVSLLMISGALTGSPAAAPLPPAPAAAGTVAGTAAPAPESSAQPVTALGFSPPTRLSIPRIGVDAPFTNLDLDGSGALNAPPVDNKNLVGWYQGGASPGEAGAAIVVGHVDTRTGPAVFLMLRTLKPGDTVDVTRADGVTAKFSVDSVQAFAKDHFPDQQVYGDTTDAQLRLITCGGTYDKAKKDYLDNVVVFAHLTSSAGPEQ